MEIIKRMIENVKRMSEGDKRFLLMELVVTIFFMIAWLSSKDSAFGVVFTVLVFHMGFAIWGAEDK